MTDKLADFFAALCSAPGFVELRALPSGEREFVRQHDAEAAVERFLADHRGKDLFFGVATRHDATSGRLDNCSYLAALFVDVDFKALPEPEARKRLRAFRLPSSALVKSGGGLHAYWLLHHSIDLPAEAERAKALLRRLARALGGDLSAAEPARVLRIPGTLNHKYTPPRPVTIELLDSERRYDLSEFDSFLPEEPTDQGQEAPFTIPEKVREGARNDRLYRLGRALKTKGLEAGEILAALETVNHSRCEPPLPAPEVRAIAEHAATQPDRPAFAAGEGVAEIPPLVVPAAHLAAPEVSYSIEPLIPAAMLTVLSGRDKRGKTLLAQEIARAALRGTPFLGHFHSCPARVLAAFLDDPVSVTLSRLDTLSIREHPDLYLVDPLRFTGEPQRFLDELEGEALRLGVGLVILDALYLLSPTSRDAGNDAARMTPLMRRLDGIATTAKAAVLVVAHDNKSGQDVAGSYVIRAMAKTILRLTLPRGEGGAEVEGVPTTLRRVLSVESKLTPATALVLELRGVGDWALLGSPQEVREGDLAGAILAYLADQPEPVPEDGIHDAVEGRRVAKQAALRRLHGEGKVTRTGAGKRGDPYRYKVASEISGTRGSPIGRAPETGNELSVEKIKTYSGTRVAVPETSRVPESEPLEEVDL